MGTLERKGVNVEHFDDYRGGSGVTIQLKSFGRSASQDLSPTEAQELACWLMDEAEAAEALRRENEKARIEQMRNEYEDRKAVQHG